MLILTQKKDTVVNLEQISIIKVLGNRDICVLQDTPGRDHVILGHYATKERCAAILDEVLRCYENSLNSYMLTDHAAQVNRPYIYAEHAVYRMPES